MLIYNPHPTHPPPQLCELRLGLLDLANNDLRGLPPELGKGVEQSGSCVYRRDET